MITLKASLSLPNRDRDLQNVLLKSSYNPGIMILQVVWVEHIEVDDRSVQNIYRPLVNSGLAFGAKRWVGTLDRQCERLASSMAINIPSGDLCGNGF
jgi:hypothetical protein